MNIDINAEFKRAFELMKNTNQNAFIAGRARKWKILLSTQFEDVRFLQFEDVRFGGGYPQAHSPQGAPHIAPIWGCGPCG